MLLFGCFCFVRTEDHFKLYILGNYAKHFMNACMSIMYVPGTCIFLIMSFKHAAGTEIGFSALLLCVWGTKQCSPPYVMGFYFKAAFVFHSRRVLHCQKQYQSAPPRVLAVSLTPSNDMVELKVVSCQTPFSHSWVWLDPSNQWPCKPAELQFWKVTVLSPKKLQGCQEVLPWRLFVAVFWCPDFTAWWNSWTSL